MKIYKALVICATCPNRRPLRNLYKPHGMRVDLISEDGDIDEFCRDRFVCVEKDEQEICLHPTIEIPDWCPLEDAPDGSNGTDPLHHPGSGDMPVLRAVV